jgi:hypothetical protein
VVPATEAGLATALNDFACNFIRFLCERTCRYTAVAKKSRAYRLVHERDRRRKDKGRERVAHQPKGGQLRLYSLSTRHFRKGAGLRPGLGARGGSGGACKPDDAGDVGNSLREAAIRAYVGRGVAHLCSYERTQIGKNDECDEKSSDLREGING